MKLRPNTLNIVIADDDMDDQDLLIQAMTDHQVDYRHTSVANGRQLMDYLLNRSAWQNTPHDTPDLILLDINMPVLNGFDALAEIRSYEQLRSIPVFVLTTGCSASDKTKAMLLGARRFYTKPSNYAGIKDLVKEVIAALTIAERSPAYSAASASYESVSLAG